VDIGIWLDPTDYHCGGEPEFCHCLGDHPRDDHGNWVTLDWVVVGGESGPGARPMHPDWVRSLRDQATAAGVPFFFKQWGEFCPPDQFPGGVPTEYEGVPLDPVRISKKRAGALLDGREWREWPRPAGETA